MTGTFPQYMLAPGAYAMVAKNPAKCQAFFGQTFLSWSTGSLNNSGEKITLLDNNNVVLDSVNFSPSSPWPSLADGDGYSLVLCDPNLDNNDGVNWTIPDVLDYVGMIDTIAVYANPGEGCQSVSMDEQNTENQFRIYPNPSAGVFYL